MESENKNNKEPAVINVGSGDEEIIPVVSVPRKRKKIIPSGSEVADDHPPKRPTKRQQTSSAETKSTATMQKQ